MAGRGQAREHRPGPFVIPNGLHTGPRGCAGPGRIGAVPGAGPELARDGDPGCPMRATLFAIASLALAVFLVLIGRSAGIGPFLHATLANLAVVTWSAFVLPLRGLPPFDEYYRLRAWERSGRVYRWLGVPIFRALVRRGPLSLPNRALPAAWHSGDPARIERETRAAEGGHGIAFVIVLVLALAALARGSGERAAWLVALDIPMNLYPMLLQRDHRLRLRKMLGSGELIRAGAPPGEPARPGVRHRRPGDGAAIPRRRH